MAASGSVGATVSGAGYPSHDVFEQLVQATPSWQTERGFDFDDDGEDCGSEVNLHVYHCDSATGFLNWAFLRSFDIGIYHAAIEVYDEEWSFQYFEDTWNDPSVSGIIRCEPKRMPNYEYQETVHLGRTSLSEAEVFRIICGLYEKWPACSYHLTHNNCIHFAEHLAGLLKTDKPFPVWTKGAMEASNNNYATDAVVSYGWSWARWWMEYKHSAPEDEHAGQVASSQAKSSVVGRETTTSV